MRSLHLRVLATSLLSLSLPGFLTTGCATPSDDAVSGTDSALAAPSPHDAHVREVAMKDQSPRMEAMFGRFASGASGYYRGTFEAKDNLSVLGMSKQDGVFPKGPAIASSIANRDGLGGVTFGVVDPVSGEHVEFFQTGATTTISLVNTAQTSGGLLSSCASCFVDLTAHPGAISFAGVVARGVYGDVPPSPSEVTASGTFDVVPPATLGFDDIQQLRMLDAAFVAAGPDMVSTARASVADFVATTEANAYPCYIASDYAIDLWVNRERITEHGLRNFRPEGTQTCCATGEGEGGGYCTPLERSKSVGTGVGNTIGVTVKDKLVEAANVTRTVHLTYSDTAGYLRHDPHAHAVVIVHTATENGDASKKLTTELSLSAQTYAGDVTLPSVAPIVSIELAFANSSETIWDSNLSRNYRIEL
jgi:hypothetical protein